MTANMWKMYETNFQTFCMNEQKTKRVSILSDLPHHLSVFFYNQSLEKQWNDGERENGRR